MPVYTTSSLLIVTLLHMNLNVSGAKSTLLSYELYFLLISKEMPPQCLYLLYLWDML